MSNVNVSVSALPAGVRHRSLPSRTNSSSQIPIERRGSETSNNAPPRLFYDFEQQENNFLELYKENFIHDETRNFVTVDDFPDEPAPLRIHRLRSLLEDILNPFHALLGSIIDSISVLRAGNLRGNLLDNLRNIPNCLYRLPDNVRGLRNLQLHKINFWDHVFVLLNVSILNPYIFQFTLGRMKEIEDTFQRAGKLLKDARKSLSELKTLTENPPTEAREEAEGNSLHQLKELEQEIFVFLADLSKDFKTYSKPDYLILDSLWKFHTAILLNIIILALGLTKTISSNAALIVSSGVAVLSNGIVVWEAFSSKLEERKIAVVKSLNESVFTGLWIQRLSSKIENIELLSELKKEMATNRNQVIPSSLAV